MEVFVSVYVFLFEHGAIRKARIQEVRMNKHVSHKSIRKFPALANLLPLRMGPDIFETNVAELKTNLTLKCKRNYSNLK